MKTEDFGKTREQLMAMPLEWLIANPLCPECRLGINFDCCKANCLAQKGYFKDGEKEKRFTEAEVKLIESQWNKQTGFLRDDGCILERRLMPEFCLRFTCNFRRKRTHIRNPK